MKRSRTAVRRATVTHRSEIHSKIHSQIHSKIHRGGRGGSSRGRGGKAGARVIDRAAREQHLRIMTPCQRSALEKVQSVQNIFLTGAAGTGKSFLVRHVIEDVARDDLPVVASTGAAAILVGGRTFHSFFGLGILQEGEEATVRRALRNRRVRNRIQRACGIVIDEVSMLSGTMLRAAEKIAREARETLLPWGGLQVIAVGDFAQLPPVTPNGEGKEWAFLDPVWERSQFVPAVLHTPVRTREPHFLHILGDVREGRVTQQVEEFLRSRTRAPSNDCSSSPRGAFGREDSDGTRLFPHRAQAEEFNLRRLCGIRGASRTFETAYAGEERYVEQLRRQAPIPPVLHLKVGALVMLRRNDMSPRMRWVNGSIGHLRRIADDMLHIVLLDGQTIEIGRESFTILNGDGNEAAMACNFPVNLAWATTIHKAQGASLDSVVLDLTELWEPGQAYVALSRARSAERIAIVQWSAESILADPAVLKFYRSLESTG